MKRACAELATHPAAERKVRRDCVQVEQPPEEEATGVPRPPREGAQDGRTLSDCFPELSHEIWWILLHSRLTPIEIAEVFKFSPRDFIEEIGRKRWSKNDRR